MAAEKVLDAWWVTGRRSSRDLATKPGHMPTYLCHLEGEGRKFGDRLRRAVHDAIDHVGLFGVAEPEYRSAATSSVIDHLLHQAEVVLFVLTKESSRVTAANYCVELLGKAVKAGKPVIVLQVSSAVRPPVDLPGSPTVDFTGDFWEGLPTLAGHLTDVGLRSRDAGPDDESYEPEPGPEPSDGEFVTVNEMPAMSTAHFRDRLDSRDLLRVKLLDERVRLIVLTGENGIGKTALLRTVRGPADGMRSPVGLSAFVYFSGRGDRWITAPAFLADLARTVTDPQVRGRFLDDLGRRPWRLLVDAVLAALLTRPIAVVIDDADDLFDGHGDWKDRDLRDLVTDLAGQSGHRVTLVLLLCELPRGLISDIQLSRWTSAMNLARGLDLGDAIDLLRGLDPGDLGLADASADRLEPLHRLTEGRPRLLELVAGLLMARDDIDVDSIPAKVAGGQHAAEVLFLLVFEVLRPYERRVLQALAVFSRPVPAAAVSELLAEVAPTLQAERILSRLAAHHLIHRYGDGYYLPAVYAGFVRSSMLTAEDAGEAGPLTLDNLWIRGAAYFAGHRQKHVERIEDLWPQFGEIELFLRAGRHVQAVNLMDEVDDGYLSRWGQSHVLSSWRADLHGELGDPALEGRNLSYLVAARRQFDGHPDDLSDITEALEHAERIGSQVNVVTVTVQLGNALMDQCRTSLAAAHYRQAAGQAHKFAMRADEIGARLNLAVCLIKGGSFDEAEEELLAAARLVERVTTPLLNNDLGVRIELNRAWLASQRGLHEDARDGLQRSRVLAERGADGVLQGGLCSAEHKFPYEQRWVMRSAGPFGLVRAHS